MTGFTWGVGIEGITVERLITEAIKYLSGRPICLQQKVEVAETSGWPTRLSGLAIVEANLITRSYLISLYGTH